MRRSASRASAKLWTIDAGPLADDSGSMEQQPEPQSAKAVLLVRPAAFGFNAEAAKSNVFSNASTDPEFASRALAEFEAFARRLADAGVEVIILDDAPEPSKPDALFPNNWLSTHAGGAMALYPMATAPRRLERRSDEVRDLVERQGFAVERVVDLSHHERKGRYLEGTGSLVLDRPRRRAYANRSPRTDADVIAEFDQALGYSTLIFDARDPGGRAIYHTNVLLSMGTRFAALCVDAVAPGDRKRLIEDIEASGRTIVELTFAQLRRFGCNLLELRNAGGDTVIALSSKAKSNLRPDQVRQLEELGGELVDADIPTIEAVGGGSVRCMIAEIHLPNNDKAR